MSEYRTGAFEENTLHANLSLAGPEKQVSINRLVHLPQKDERKRDDIDLKNDVYVLGRSSKVDLTLESRGRITVFEAKNKFSEDFAKYQIYFPFRKYYDEYMDGKIKLTNIRDIFEIDSCYVQRKEVDGISVIRMYLYTFTDKEDICSIELKDSCEYRLIPN